MMDLFEQACNDAARNFIEHVVFIDDYLVGVDSQDALTADDPPSEIIAPPSSPDDAVTAIQDDREVSAGESELEEGRPEGEGDWHQLRIKKVAEEFADHGIVTGFFLLPKVAKGQGQPEKVVQRVRKLAGKADVVLVDWSVHGDSGTFATNLVSWMDSDADARRQLVIIFTGETDRGEIVSRLTNQNAVIVEEKNALRFRLPNGTVVSVIQKPDVPPDSAFFSGSACTFSELPKRVIHELAVNAGGILASAAMEGLAKIRANTHFLLREFGPQADPAYVVHRAATVPPTDAEEQLSELFADVTRDLLADPNWRHSTTREVIREWLTKGNPDELVAIIARHGKDFSIEDALLLLVDGPNALVTEKQSSLSEKKQGKLERHFNQCYEEAIVCVAKARGLTNAENTLPDARRFAALSYSRLLVGGEAPRLQLGTIVYWQDDYWVCIQPVCDAARVPPDEGRSFPFLRLRKVKVEGDAALHLLALDDSELVGLKVEEKLYNVTTTLMKPESDHPGPILARRDEDEEWWFPESMRFVCSLRTAIAQRIANNLANTTGRVGLMENEFVRRRSGS